MAGARRMMVCMGAMVALALISGVTARHTHDKKVDSTSFLKVREEGCPEEDYAYPFQSVCDEPALFDTEYHLVAPFSNALVAKGGLTKGGVDSPVTFTGNASDEGYRFTFTPFKSAENITLGTAFTITNTETGLKIGWQYSTWHLKTILAYLSDSSMATEFQLARACNVPLPCPETTGARCESYYLLSAGFTGLTFDTGFDLLGSTIVPAGSESNGNMPLLLRRVDTDANIRSVVRGA